VGFEALIGVAVGSSHVKYAIGLVAGVAACWLIWRFPLAGCVLCMFLVAGIIRADFYHFSAGGHLFYGYEVVLVVLLLRAAISPRRHTWGGAAGGWLAAFLALLILSTALAITQHNTSLNNAINWGRVFFVMTFYWVVVRLAPERRQLGLLLLSGIAIGALSGIVGLILALSGNLHSVFQDAGDQVLTTSSIGSLLRVRMPGLGLGFMLLWLAVVWLIRGRSPKWLWVVSIPWILVDILVSQNRNMWVISVGMLVLVLLVAGPRVRGRLVTSLVVLAAAVAVVVAAPQGGGAGPTPLAPIIARASTILNPHEVSESSSASDRDYEDRTGWANAQHHLAIGIGVGVSYGATIATGSGSSVTTTPRLFLQNQYLYLLVVTGIPGVATWILFLLTSLRNAFVRGAAVESRVLGIGILGLSLTAIVMLSFTDGGFLVALALSSGAVFLLRPSVATEPVPVRQAALVPA
jgi:O-Antigen ligase